MEKLSTSEQLRQLSFMLSGQLRHIVAGDMAEQKLLEAIRLLQGQIRDDYQGYEFADSGREQALFAAKLRKRLGKLNGTILKASEHNLFGPVEVAELSTAIELLQERIGS